MIEDVRTDLYNMICHNYDINRVDITLLSEFLAARLDEYRRSSICKRIKTSLFYCENACGISGILTWNSNRKVLLRNELLKMISNGMITQKALIVGNSPDYEYCLPQSDFTVNILKVHQEKSFFSATPVKCKLCLLSPV